MSIRVVTDSRCDLPSPLVEALGIEIVPLTIRFGDEELVDQEELSTAEFWDRLEQLEHLPETAAPSPGAFEANFRGLVERGATGIVCINLSSHLSGTMQSAQVAAAARVRRVPGAGDRLAERVDGPRQPVPHRGAAGGRRRLAGVDRHRGRRPARPHQAVRDARHPRAIRKRGRHRQRPRAARVDALDQAGDRDPGRDRRGGRARSAPGRRRSSCSRRRRRRRRSSTSRCCTATHPTSTSCSTCSRPIFPRDEIITGVVGPVIGTHAGPRVIGVTFQVVHG